MAAAVTFVTTEHFTGPGARSSTISEVTGRASVFLSAVSGGLIALGLVATAATTGWIRGSTASLLAAHKQGHTEPAFAFHPNRIRCRSATA